MMASRLLDKSRTVLLSKSGLRTLAQNLQLFSSNTKWGRSPSSVSEESSASEEPSATIWPDPNLGVLAPRDKRLPFPGNIGPGNLSLSQLKIPPRQRLSTKDEGDILTCQLPFERHITFLAHFVNPDQLDEGDELDDSFGMPNLGDVLECVAQECPALIRKDFSDLFPGIDTMTGPFTVLTLSQKTENNMSGWDDPIELEREELLLYFVIAAEQICSHLKELGYWADFIDPSSGRPSLGPYTSATMFETDERYRHLGFRIEDLGCCKVISHRTWGTNVFVGCLFTNAPASSPHIKSIIDRHSGRKQND